MMTGRWTYVGIDLTCGHKICSYAALDAECKLLALGAGSLHDALSYVAGLSQAFVALGAPARLNQGVMNNPAVRQGYTPPPPPRLRDLRQAEYELLRQGVEIPRTPATVEACPPWVKQGFEGYARLKEMGYSFYPNPETEHQVLEVNPEACYWAWLGRVPFEAHSLEGRIQRQLVLHDLHLPVHDPMDFFEEVTRFKLLRGILPLKDIYSAPELNAWAAAYTAWLAANQPEEMKAIGAPEEGQIHLPCWPVPVQAKQGSLF